MIRLHANESPYDLLTAFRSELNQAISSFAFNEYPDATYRNLRAAIGDYAKADPNKIIVGNGSDELIKLLLDTFTTEESYVLAPTPSFIEYREMSRVKGCNFCEVRPDEDLKFNTTEFLRQMNTLNPELVFICTPNNPTGEKLSTKDMQTIIETTKALVVVDEAYIEFSEGSITNWTEKYSNLIVLRTLSKAFGLASLRIGYGVACESIIRKLNNNRMPYNVSGLSAMTAELALKHIDYRTIVNQIKSEKNRVEEAIKTLPIKYYPSEANFILVNTPFTDQIVKKLAEKNIKVRSFDDSPLLNGHFRFSIGEPKVNTQVINTIREVLLNENI